MKGRKPTPTHLRLVKGNPGRRPINDAEPQPPRPATLAPPEHLTPVAAETWRRLAPQLDDMGVLSAVDGSAFERLCECYAEIRHCQLVIETEGDSYETHSVAGGRMIRANPAVARLADADRRFKGYLSDFGLTPAARTKIKVNSHGSQADPFEKYFE